jgi:hypothetical protein
MSNPQTGTGFMHGHFDESSFAPAESLRDSYRRCVARGYQRMHSLRAVIAGLARNIEPILPATISRIARLGSLFADFRVVIYENDTGRPGNRA